MEQKKRIMGFLTNADKVEISRLAEIIRTYANLSCVEENNGNVQKSKKLWRKVDSAKQELNNFIGKK